MDSVVPGPPARDHDTVLYDGGCGLCQRSVRWLLARDPEGSRFRFAPLGGRRSAELLTDRERLPDSLVVSTADGRTLVRSAAVIHLLRRSGRAWSAAGRLLACVPRPLRDRGYDAVAARRRRWFAAPESDCPGLPPELARRFDP